jgi:hypothetical protein
VTARCESLDVCRGGIVFGDGVQQQSDSVERRTEPVTVRGAVWKPVAWTIASAAITVLGMRMAVAAEFYGDAVFTRVTSSAFTIGVGFGAVILGILRLRTRVRVFPDRLEAIVGLGRKDVVLPGDVVVIRPTGAGHVGIRGVTGRRRRGFIANRFDRHYDVLADWLHDNATEPWTSYQDLLGKLTHLTRPRVVHDMVTGVLAFVVLLPSLALLPALVSLTAYDDAHIITTSCTVESASGGTVSTRSLRGIGSSRSAVFFEASDCGRLTFDRGISDKNRDEIARRYDEAPGTYTFKVGAASFWIRKNMSWLRLSPEVYSVSAPR